MRADILPLLAAFTFAFGNVLQQKGTLETPSVGDDPRFLVQTPRHPVWLARDGMQATGWCSKRLHWTPAPVSSRNPSRWWVW